MLALDEELLREYFAFQKGRKEGYNKITISRLFKYLQPFILSVKQKDDIGLSNEIAKSLCDSGLVKISTCQNEDDLIQKTKLKVMLTQSSLDGTFPYPYINILDDEIGVSFTATYKSGENRDKAKEHIKALLLDANEISIYDRYLSANNSWNINKQVLFSLLPLKSLIIKIFCDIHWSNNKKADLENYYATWSIEKEDWNTDIHDRYIETDKVIILLSSGFINLGNNSKDFTYIVKLK